MEKENIELIKSYFQNMTKGDMAEVNQLIGDDVIWHQPGNSSVSGIYKGKQELFSHLGKMMGITQGTLKLEPIQIMANADLVSVILQFSASREGMSMSMKGIDLLRIQDGQIKEVWLFSENQEAEDKFWAL